MISTTSAILALFLALDIFSTYVLAVPFKSDHRQRACKDPLQRKEWRALSDDEKQSYIDAVKCLQSQPVHNASLPSSWTRFDEFQATHIGLSYDIHFVGQFLPWHRLFVKSYENALRGECGYQGAQPYWNWSIDSDPPNRISQSPIWDPDTGFGGDGVPGTYTVPPDPANTSRILPWAYRGCVEDGPFADYTIKMGPGLLVTEHCLTRGINDTSTIYLNSSAIAQTLSYPTFEKFRVELEGTLGVIPRLGPHIGGHVAVGGEMSNFFSSPADPLFYLHHTNLDRIWWHWQQLSSERLYEVSGPTSITPPFGNLTLDYRLQMGNIGTTRPVRDIMDIRRQPSCYTYI